MKTLWLLIFAVTCMLLPFMESMDVENKDRPVLIVELFSAPGSQAVLEGLEKNKIKVSYQEKSTDPRVSISHRVAGFLAGPVANPTAFARYQKELDAKDLEYVRWMKNRYLIALSVNDKREIFQSAPYRLNLELFDYDSGKVLKEDIELEPDKLALAAVARGREVLVLGIQVNESEARYSSVFKWDDFTVYSQNSVWHDGDLSGPQVVFPRAKAVMTKDREKLVLIADKIVYNKQKRHLVGENARLIGDDGKLLGKGKTIEVDLRNPHHYKIR